jgi:Holliday junction resolvase RusA-like endonuclease
MVDMTELNLEIRPKKSKVFNMNPVPKPRMTQSDKWNKRKEVQKYWTYKQEINLRRGNFEMPECGYHLIFYIPMPKSWSRKKKAKMAGEPHQSEKADKDNLEKGFLDALCQKDGHIWDGRVSKYWAYRGKIEVYW